jgi:hypothetical protein
MNIYEFLNINPDDNFNDGYPLEKQFEIQVMKLIEYSNILINDFGINESFFEINMFYNIIYKNIDTFIKLLNIKHLFSPNIIFTNFPLNASDNKLSHINSLINSNIDKIIIALDLDETLVHVDMFHSDYIYIRPGVKQLLSMLLNNKHIQLLIWTNGHIKHAIRCLITLISIIDPTNIKLFENTIIIAGYNTEFKNNKNVFLIDNDHRHFNNGAIGILVATFVGLYDKHLFHIHDILNNINFEQFTNISDLISHMLSVKSDHLTLKLF